MYIEPRGAVSRGFDEPKNTKKIKDVHDKLFAPAKVVKEKVVAPYPH